MTVLARVGKKFALDVLSASGEGLTLYQAERILGYARRDGFWHVRPIAIRATRGLLGWRYTIAVLDNEDYDELG